MIATVKSRAKRKEPIHIDLQKIPTNMNTQLVRNVISPKLIAVFFCFCQVAFLPIFGQIKSNNESAKWALVGEPGIQVIFDKPVCFRFLIYEFEIKSKYDSLVVNCRNCVVTKKETRNRYHLWVSDSLITPSLEIFNVKWGQRKSILSSNLQVCDLPITVLLGNKYSGSEVNLKNLKEERFVATIVNYNVSNSFRIESITMTTLVDEAFVSIRSEGNRINEEQIAIIEKLPESQIIIFKVDIRRNEGSLLTLDPVFFIIKR